MSSKAVEKLYQELSEEIIAFSMKGNLKSGTREQLCVNGMFMTLECFDDGEGLLILRLKRYSKSWGKGIYEFLGRVLNRVVRQTPFLTWRMWKYEGVMIEFDLVKKTKPIE